ncbi:uncharacterized protein BP01DRAFT_360918 [Aspergillus saccharolyticus JOP 1030-1]|uniref:Uncharacterized protein n=1 Tax=Aspergillus saccharolyticus JOP 1030-1 TaxID=1450539 RepID=A0A318Z0Q0_9EURO|nr:hypothetical protein BP01DRAFT_360918 [Aspergillus saccharolyticus JOP 1030-1]PYH40855.1 hypothetical protein BP01DRAFT_360918 [Aspergillus saccharolyticus JOP 1030-1]
MHLRCLIATSLSLVGSLASPVLTTDHGDQTHLAKSPPTRPAFPTVTGHEVHLPCLQPPQEDEDHRVDNGTSTPFVSMNVRTEHNALFVNNISVFPAAYPMRLSAPLHHEGRNRNRNRNAAEETVVLTYGVDIEYLPPKVDAQLGDLYFVEVKFFDATGRPATAEVIHVRLSRDSDEDDLIISQIIVEPLVDSRASHGHGNSVWHAQYWQLLVRKYKDWQKAPKKAFHPSLHSGARTDRGTPPPHVGDKSPFAVTGETMTPHDVYHHHHRANPNFWRLIVPATVPAVLGMVAGLVVCTTAVLVWKVVGWAWGWCRATRRRRCARGERCCRGVEEAWSEKQQLMVQAMGAVEDV